MGSKPVVGRGFHLFTSPLRQHYYCYTSLVVVILPVILIVLLILLLLVLLLILIQIIITILKVKDWIYS